MPSSRMNSQAVFSEAILPQGTSRLSSFGTSLVLQCVILASLVIIPMLMPKRMQIAARSWVISIADPPIRAWKPQPQAKPVLKKVIVQKPVEQAVEAPKPKIYNPVIASPVVAKPVVKKQQAPDMTEVAKAFPVPSLGSSAIPTLKKPREDVQTGGFGDPNSVPDNHNLNRAVNMNQLGSYDLPAGPGSGNGTGGVKGAKGVVASTGFGNGVATGNGPANHGSVQQGLFGDEHAAPPQVKQTSATVGRSKAMELVSVPRPQYPDEARAKKIQGDVVLQVVFLASGEVKVLRVVQGLGYGLDEAAEAAARQIQFHPALQDGQPVDVTANVRMKCELAY